MSDASALWFIRHGEPHPDVRGRCYGRLDVGLSDEGRRQMAQVAARLAGVPLAAIYASPRKRTIESAEALAARHACGIQVLDALREIDFGDFEGMTYDAIARDHAELYRQWMETPTEVQFPNGESYSIMRVRVARALDELLARHAGESIALVTHGGVNRIILAGALSIPPDHVFRVGQRYAALNLIRYTGDYPIVEIVNGQA